MARLEASMARRPRDSEWISVVRIQAMLDISEVTLLRHARRHQVESRRVGSAPSLLLADLILALPPTQARRIRESMRSERMAVRTSKNWIAGFPELVAQWHPTNNFDLFPDQVRAGSARRIWWLCPKHLDHVWQSQARVRTAGSNCPYCANQRLSRTNSLSAIAALVAREWHPDLNAKSPDDVIAGSHSVAWWRCKKDFAHVWRASVHSRVSSGAGCPYCARQRVEAKTSLSSVAPSVAREWHQERNNGIGPGDVLATSGESRWWRCGSNPAHVWKTSIRNRVLRKTGCPFCGGYRADGANSLSSPALLSEWDRVGNGNLTPRDVRPGSGRVVSWVCSNDSRHRWTARVAARSAGAGCPYCAGQRVNESNSLQALQPALAEQWHTTRNRDLLPTAVTERSSRTVWWLCPRKHSYKARIFDRTRGRQCRICSRA